MPADHDDGEYDTSDRAIPDGRGSIRLLGRDADRVGGVLMIPAAGGESALLEHPAVRDVALVGYPDSTGGEPAAAVSWPRRPSRRRSPTCVTTSPRSA
ncbi:hypothetical protein AB0F91_31545 [Amycolatopsis sp. NPDC023774]|uniref:hypothetical protein n=1 Tax=Amycolatopsis sp. NPDC023774 TaxID=3155015 RepID=UPI0033C0D2C3